MSYTRGQIELMAKLAPDVKIAAITWSEKLQQFEAWTEGPNIDTDKWMPWSDWRDLGPLWMACLSWGVRNHATNEIEQPFIDVEKASESGDFDTFATAVCNLAIEIGSTIE